MPQKVVRRAVASAHGHLSRAVHNHDDHHGHENQKYKKPRHLFEDPEELKAEARRDLLNPFDVTKLYQDGILDRI